MADIVLDASAVLALMQAEPGSDVVAATLPGALLGIINLAEVLTKLHVAGMPVDQSRSAVSSLGIRVADFAEEQARIVAEFRPLTITAGLSLGDRACLALAKARRLPALTGERLWPQFAEATGVDIRLIR